MLVEFAIFLFPRDLESKRKVMLVKFATSCFTRDIKKQKLMFIEFVIFCLKWQSLIGAPVLNVNSA